MTAHADTFARDGLPPRDAWPELIFELPELAYPDQLNAATALLDKRFADRPCVHGSDAVWSYAELAERSDRIARVLVEDMGLVPGNRVLLRAPNTPELIACWFGVLKAGGVVVATMPMLRAGELAKIIAKGLVTHALCDARLRDELAAARQREPVLEHVLRAAELEARRRGGAFTAVATQADDVALIAFTSGTTGEPKGCLHLHRDLLATCDTFARHILDPQPDEVFTGTPPLAFTYGLGGLVLFPLRFGASRRRSSRPGRDALLEAVERHGITTLFTAPTGYRALLGSLRGSELSSLRKCVAAGEPCRPPPPRPGSARTGIRIVDGIGSTEMLHIFIASPADAGAARLDGDAGPRLRGARRRRRHAAAAAGRAWPPGGARADRLPLPQ